ncbi:hypothetical protein [Acidiphilium sp.]|uniref:hypothetical protein n=1 Tax=Acidiphilium sp. TaxID=527 RepID=UPI003CFD7BC3
MTDTLDPAELARLRLVAENPLARPSERVAARRVLRELRDAETRAADEADRRELLAVIRRTIARA